MNIKLLHISIKMTLAGFISIFIAKALNIEFYTTAAAVSILSIQWTKRDFLNVAIKRIVSGIFAIFFSAFLFHYLGNNFWIFALFLIIFTNLSWAFSAPEGIVPSVVIVTHILSKDIIVFNFLLEEVLLLFIAVGVAFVINMLYPQYNKKEMKINLLKVDKIIEDELEKLVKNLKNEQMQSINIDIAKENLQVIMKKAHMIDKDIIMQNDHRYITYLYMRNIQLEAIGNMQRHLSKINNKHQYKIQIADFLDKVSKNISYNNKAQPLLDELESLNEFFIKSPLPNTREEFEVRAFLFLILNEIESFLKVKTDFHKKYPTFHLDMLQE